jgi:putative N6-adenine-specific DNA methylase
MEKRQYYAACAFGLEAVVAHELKRLAVEEIETRDARVYFKADEEGLAQANVCLRCADRIYMVLSEFFARTFEELFDGVAQARFGDLIPPKAKMPVAGDAVGSVLGSVSDIQAVSKRAVIESMKRSYGNIVFEESKSTYQIYVSIVRDQVSVCLNTSGAGLNRRGYRVKNSTAPLKETLAAALLKIARWYAHPLYDPMCGSGTIAVEGAMMAQNIMPGASRSFAAQHFSSEFKRAFDIEKQRAADGVRISGVPIFASDIDKDALELAKFHAGRAGVLESIRFSRADAVRFTQETDDACIVTNPPYAQRMGEQKDVDRLYKQIGKAFFAHPDNKVFVLTADNGFESKFGRRADKKRKLYNGNIKCTFYQYFRKA